MGAQPLAVPEAHKLRLKEFFDQIWNGRRLDRFEDFVALDFIMHGGRGTVAHGIAGARAFTKEFLDAVPDYHIELLDMLAADDRVAVRWICRGTHQGRLMGVPGTGRAFELSGISIYRFREGKLAEVWRERDLPGMWRDLLPAESLTAAGTPEPRVVAELA